MNCKLPETKRQSSQISMEADRYGQLNIDEVQFNGEF